MARFLAYTSPARGHLYPIVPTLLELRRRGHDVHVRTLASEVEGLLRVGLEAQPILPAIEDLRLADWEADSPEEGLAGVLRTLAARSDHEIADVQQAISEFAPDVLLVDKTTPGAAAVADAESLPWAQWMPFFEHYAVEPGVLPDVTFIPYSLHPAGMEALNRPRLKLGLQPFDETSNMWRAGLYLYLTAAPFEHQELRLPPNFAAVGPGVWEPEGEIPQWLDGLAGPVVLITASSEFQRDDALIAVALEALQSEDVRVIATTAAHDPKNFKIPSNARVERWLPHGAVLARAACVVCHGGMGITQKALSAGVPVCVVPFGRDQFEVAGRVAAVGAGTHVMPNDLTPDKLREAVREAMGMRAGAQRVSDAFAQAGGATAAANELEALLSDVRDKQESKTGV